MNTEQKEFINNAIREINDSIGEVIANVPYEVYEQNANQFSTINMAVGKLLGFMSEYSKINNI